MRKSNLSRIIEGIQKRDHKVLSDIYKVYYPKVLGYIVKHGGNETEAKDIFQETIMIIFKYSQNGKLDNLEDLGSFVIGISKRIWLRQIRKASTHERYLGHIEYNDSEAHPSDQELEHESQLALIRKHIVKLGKECQQVLRMVAEGLKNEEISKKMSYKSEKTVRTKKYKCKEALINFIKSDPNYQDGAQ